MSVFLHQIVAANGKEVDDFRYFDLFLAIHRRACCGTMLHLYKDGTTAWRRSCKGFERRYIISCFFPPFPNRFYRLPVVEDQ